MTVCTSCRGRGHQRSRHAQKKITPAPAAVRVDDEVEQVAHLRLVPEVDVARAIHYARQLGL